MVIGTAGEFWNISSGKVDLLGFFAKDLGNPKLGYAKSCVDFHLNYFELHQESLGCFTQSQQ